jgi:cytochrome c-type biogenesis protein CcmF
MEFGKLLIILGLISTVISAFYYLILTRETKDKSKKKSASRQFNMKLARGSYYAMVLLTAIASIYLLYLFLTHQFQFRYVFQYSSRSLGTALLISSFWAGQEGSFLLWTLLTAVMGVVFIRKAKNLEYWTMFFVNLIQIFFFILLIKASPFVTQGQTPPDGSGLNPLLQNFWMVIHPPILFVGYAAITFPFALALSGLVTRSYKDWIDQAMPWTIFSSITLGAGIIIGGFWAYETLGWGGYWGWDPVENSSLIPWLTILALMHGFIVQKRNGALARTNFSFAIISYLLVLYATFLTRSGILADFSVHSFQDLGINALLIIFVSVSLGISLVLMYWRFKEIPRQSIDLSAPNRENALVASLWAFAASGFLIFIGTSSPIITGIFGTASQVDVSFYDKVNLPVGILMGLLLGITPFLLWAEKDIQSVPKRLLLPLILAIATAVIIYIAGLTDILDILLALTGTFALTSNVIVLVRQLRPNWLNIGAPLAHFGFGIMLLGIIVSGNFSTEERLLLNKNTPAEALGYKLTYKGYIQSPDGKNLARVEVEHNGSTYMAQPRLYNNTYGEGVMREPDVSPGIISDIYISPLERRTGQHNKNGTQLSLVKGQTETAGIYTITFDSFEMSNHEEAGHFSVGAVLKVSVEDQTYRVTPLMQIGASGRQAIPAALPHEESSGQHVHPSVVLQGMNADEKRINLLVNGIGESITEAAEDQLLIEFSKKPFMSILWIGTVILILGSVIAWRKRVVMV